MCHIILQFLKKLFHYDTFKNFFTETDLLISTQMVHSVFNTKPPSFSIKEAKDAIQHQFNFRTCSDLDELYSDRDQNFFFRSNSKKYILKIFNKAEDISVIKLQLDAIKYISKKNMNILLPFPKSEIVKIFKDKEVFRTIVYEYIDGYFFSEKQLFQQDYRKLGIFIGNISKALNGFRGPGSERVFEWDIQHIDLINHRLKFIDSITNQNIVRYFLNKYEENVAPHTTKLRMAVIHNDCNEHNIIVNEKKTMGIIDFGDMLYSFQVLEPAVCMAYLALNKNNIKSVLCTFLESYQSCFPLNEYEVRCLIYMVCVRLCISVSMAAWRKSMFPENKYLTISERPAWLTLKYFKDENLNKWTDHLLQTRG